MKKINFLRRGAGILSMLVVCLCLFVNTSWAQTVQRDTLKTNAVWTVPTGVNTVTIEAIGGGGAAGLVRGGDGDDWYNVTGGGGGGAYAKKTFAVTPGTDITVTIGAGGRNTATNVTLIPGRFKDQVVTDGGNTIIKIGGATVLTANGGKTVTGVNNTDGAAGGAATVGEGVTSHAGGRGGDATNRCGSLLGRMSSGGGGGAGYATGNGGNGGDAYCDANNGWGAGGTSAGLGGNGGRGVSDFNNVGGYGPEGQAGLNYGGGGGGGKTGVPSWYPGAAGAPGVVVITYTVTCDATPGAITGTQWICNTDTFFNINNLTSATSTNPGTYFWERGSSDAGPWTTINGNHENCYGARQSGCYRRGYAVDGCESVYTTAICIVRPSTSTTGLITFHGSSAKVDTGLCKGSDINITLGTTLNPTISPSLIQWQTSSDNSTWTDATTGHTYNFSQTNVTTKTYIRYIRIIGACELPSNSTFLVNVYEKPVVSNIAAPVDLCPGNSSYQVVATITPGSTSTISTYTWTGATSTNSTGVISATIPNCGQTYNYSLKVKDANGCESAVKSGSFTTNNPSDSLSKITTLPQQIAELNGECIFKAPTTSTLNALNDALKAACGNEITAFTYSASTPLNAGASSNYYINTITDMCGAHSGLNIQVPVKAPDGPTMTVVAVDTFLCPNATTTLSANTTSTDLTYDWTPGHATTSTLTVTGENNGATAVEKTYSLTITDANGCTATDDITIVTAPKAYLQNVTFPPACMPDTASINPNTIAGNIIPNGNDGTYTYQTGYKWKYEDNANVTGMVEHFYGFYYPANTTDSLPLGILNNTSLTTQTVTYNVLANTQMWNGATYLVGCESTQDTVKVLVKPSVENIGAITDFQDGTDTIVLWYGFCDTLHVITPPAYQNHIDPADLTITLSNSKGGTTNTGAFFGRMQPGVDYVITWTLEDECGHKLEFVKHYMVIYPNCGDNDPNFSVHPYVAIDADGIQYPTVRIGCECWIAENLQTVTGAAVSKAYKSDMYPDEVANVAKFGRLYSWYTAVGVTEGDDNAVPTVITEPSSKLKYVNGVCPTGWALPSMADLNNMVNLAGGVNNVKSADQSTWLPGAAGTDLSGFDAVGAGYYDPTTDLFLNLLGETNFWSMENATITQGKCGQIAFTCPEFISKEVAKGMGFSVRCLRRANP